MNLPASVPNMRRNIEILKQHIVSMTIIRLGVQLVIRESNIQIHEAQLHSSRGDCRPYGVANAHWKNESNS